MLEQINLKNLIVKTNKQAIKKIKSCYHPNCDKKSINSHILQRNGILNQISTKDNHVWEKKIDHYNENTFYFAKEGLKDVLSFNCFCHEHDKNLFKKIEDNIINFEEYETCLLFTLRTLYNEIWKKEVIIEQYKLMMKSEYSSKLNLPYMLAVIEQQLLGINDLKMQENDIWNDLNNNTQTFIFNYRKLKKIDICLSGFYNYETTREILSYKFLTGKDMERISSVFINLFPYKDETILLMGYNKNDELKLKPYFNTFFKESEKKTQTKITNLLLFACETWVISEKLYNEKIKKVEEIFISAIKHSIDNDNEREFFKVNIFSENFTSDMNKIKRYVS